MEITNLLNSIVKHAANKGKTVPLDIYNKRLSICHRCEFYQRDAQQCLKCGCFLAIKASWSSESCPLPQPKWTEYKNEGRPSKKACCG